MPDISEVNTSEGEKLADKEGIQFNEVSAKTNENLKSFFFSAVAELPFFEKFAHNKQKIVNELRNFSFKA